MERSTKRGKGPRRTRYIQYCTWTHALLERTENLFLFSFRLPMFVLQEHVPYLKSSPGNFFNVYSFTSTKTASDSASKLSIELVQIDNTLVFRVARFEFSVISFV